MSLSISLLYLSPFSLYLSSLSLPSPQVPSLLQQAAHVFLRMQAGDAESASLDESQEYAVESLLARYKHVEGGVGCTEEASCRCYPVHLRLGGQGPWIPYARFPNADPM